MMSLSSRDGAQFIGTRMKGDIKKRTLARPLSNDLLASALQTHQAHP
jgi:hypothetical protein